MREAEVQIGQLFDLDGDRHVHPARVEDAKLRDHPFLPSLRDERNPVLLFHPEPDEPGRAPVDERADVVVGEALPCAIDLLEDHRSRAEAVHALFEERRECGNCAERHGG